MSWFFEGKLFATASTENADNFWYTVKKWEFIQSAAGSKKKKISVSFSATLLRKVTFGENQKLFVFH